MFYGGSGGDCFQAGSGNDTIYGESGRTTVWAGAGNDVVYDVHAGSANVIGHGNATFICGAGTDWFVFEKGHGGGTDVIKGFLPGKDYLTLQGFGANAVSAALATAKVAGGSLSLALTDGTKVTLAGVKSLTSHNFI